MKDWRAWAALGAVCVLGGAAVLWVRCGPQARPVPVLEPGGYVLVAGGVEEEAAFRPDGYFVRRHRGRYWRGTWRQKGAVVEVAESPPGGGETRRWTITLTGPREGTLGGGTPVRLEVRGRED